MEGRVWFYLDRRKRVGPVNDPGMRALVSAGHVFSETFVWTEGLDRWTRLAYVDEFNGVARPAPPDRIPPAPDRFTQMLLPPGRSPWAMAAGYLAVLSVFGIPAPLAVAAGATGLRDIRRMESATGRRPPGSWRCALGIVIGSVGTLVLVWLVVSAALR